MHTVLNPQTECSFTEPCKFYATENLANFIFIIFITNMMINNNITFRAKPGARIINCAKKEFGNNPQKIEKYINLYSNTFSANLDKNTIVDLSKDNKYIFSHENFSGIKYVSNAVLDIKSDMLQSLLQECPKTLARIEDKLFRTIISASIKQGKSIQDLYAAAAKIINDKSKKHFLDNLNLAELIIKENPNSKLSDWDFDNMNIKLMEKEANTPGTDLYNLIHSFNTNDIDYI